MEERKRPLCHRSFNNPNIYVPTLNNPKIYPLKCAGSACPMWVPATTENQKKPQTMVGEFSGEKDGDMARYHRGPPDGTGWCADNLLREPWPDPAGGGE